MPKRIALFILGFFVALGAFLLYQHFSGTTYTPGMKKPTVVAGPVLPGKTPSYEKRDPEGRLEYLITCESIEQLKGPNGEPLVGQLVLKKPVATFYDKSGRTAEIRGDTCRAVIDQGFKGGGLFSSGGGDGAGKGDATRPGKEKKEEVQPLRLGQLSGHVRLTISGLPSDAEQAATNPAALARQGGVTVFCDDDLEFDGNQEILSSPGKIYVRSNAVAFDGEGLQLAFNRASNRIEYLRIEKGNEVIIRGIGPKALSLADTTTTAPDTRMAARGAGGGANAGARGAAVQAARGKNAKDAGTPPTTYKLAFGQDVHASVGESVMTSDRLYLIFMAAQELLGGDQGNGQNNGAATQGAAGPAVATTTPAGPTDAPGPIAPPTSADLVVRWTGSMEMRPAGAEDLALADGRDVALEAVGTADRPVEIHDPRFAAKAGRLWYHANEQRIKLEPEDFNHVELIGPTQGTIICREVSIFQLEKRAELLGPGTLEAKTGGVRPGAGAGGGKAGSTTTVAWNDRMDLELVSVPDAKDPGKSNMTVRRAVLSKAAIRGETLDLTADLLDVLIANTGDTKQPQVLEHLLATGNVVVHSLRRNRVNLLPTDLTDGISTPRLEVLTAADGPNGVLVPSQMIASGGPAAVKAWRFEDEKDQAKTDGAATAPAAGLRKEMITTSRLVADMKPKPAAGTGRGDVVLANATMGDLGQNFPDVTHLVATGGARVDVTPSATSKSAPIVVMADALDADPVARTAVLRAAEVVPAVPVHVAVGENSIEGPVLLIDQNKDTFKIAGGGQMLFTRTAGALAATGGADPKAAKAPTPMRVTWTRNMDYDNKEKLALFYGSPLAQIVDEDPDRGFLKCEEVLKVQGVKETAATRPAQGGLADAGNFVLDTIEADGKVEAHGEQLGTDNTLLTRIRISSEKLIYHDFPKKVFDVPGPGYLLVDNNRPDKPGDTRSTAGTYGFQWNGGLNYSSSEGIVKFQDQVRFVFQPRKALNVSSSSLMNPGATTAHKVNEIQLDTDRLTAVLTQTKDAAKTAASPIGLGDGGNFEVSKVDAENGAQLYARDTQQIGNEFRLIGDSLHFDALTHTAIVEGNRQNDAQVIQPGEAVTFSPKITWDMTKDRNAFSGKFRGSISGN